MLALILPLAKAENRFCLSCFPFTELPFHRLFAVKGEEGCGREGGRGVKKGIAVLNVDGKVSGSPELCLMWPTSIILRELFVFNRSFWSKTNWFQVAAGQKPDFQQRLWLLLLAYLGREEPEILVPMSSLQHRSALGDAHWDSGSQVRRRSAGCWAARCALHACGRCDCSQAVLQGRLSACLLLCVSPQLDKLHGMAFCLVCMEVIKKTGC